MPQYKVTFIFNLNRQGWSETYYNFQPNLKSVFDAANNLAKKRALLMGTGSIIEAMRIVDVAKPRQCSLYAISGLKYQEEFTDAPWTSMLTELCAGDAEYRRALMLRGLPDAWTVWDPISGQMANTNVAQAAFDVFLTALKSGWQLRVISKDPADVNKLPVGALGVAANGDLTVTIAGTNSAAGEGIRFTEFVGPDAKILNHVFKISKVVGNVLTLDFKAVNLSDIDANGGGKSWSQKIVYRPITDGARLRPAKRDTGRAFFVPRGRRPR